MKTALQAPSKTQTQPAAAPWSAPLVQHRCACGMAAGFDGHCGDCRRQAFVGDKPVLVQPKLKIGRSDDKSMHSFMEPHFGHDFSRVKVNFGSETDLSGSIQTALRSAGQPLSGQSRQDFIKEGLPEEKLEAIRVHTDHQSARSARLLGAHAYQLGNHIVFGSGAYQPETNDGNKLLRHEVAHVIQTGGRIPMRREISLQDCMSERQAADFALKKFSNSGILTLTAVKPACHLLRDSRLGEALEHIRHLPVPYSPQAKVQEIHEILRNINLNDPDNLYPVVATIESTFGVDESGPILTDFLAMIDSENPARSVSNIQQPSAEDEDRMQRQIQLMQIGPRGPYKQHGVGVSCSRFIPTYKSSAPAASVV